MAAPTYTLAEGVPYADPTTAQHFGGNSIKGLMLLQDTQLIETLAHFSRERIPERVVHARAAGAFGEFEVTHDVSQHTSAKFLSGIGTKSKVLLRVSTVGPERGSADTVRDVRGWGMKIFTEEGNQDWVFNDIVSRQPFFSLLKVKLIRQPVFFVRDPIKFPSLNRSHKRNPRTNVTDATMADHSSFHNNNQEGIHALMHLFSGRGTPKSIRHLNSYSGHTYKLTKDDGTFHYVKIHIKTNQGVQNLSQDEAVRLAGENPDYHTADLYGAIEAGDFPSWTVFFQIMEPQDAEKYRWNIFDMTKVWPHSDYPLIPVGKLTLNKNPSNYFADIEQAAFSPSNMVRGFAPSADPMLQARMFAYNDAARYRLGVNYQQLPCNRAVSPVYCPYQRDGFMTFGDNYGADPNYVRSDLKPVNYVGSHGASGYAIGGHEDWVGHVCGFTSEVVDDDFAQARAFWEVLGKQPGEQEALVHNVAQHMGGAAPAVHEKAFGIFARVDQDLGERIRAAVLGAKLR
ncbi:Catalase [Colletotrichum higginsianum IMI 349063]|uniref:Catalase n=2 Tax=Colletotrichum higginsianum (strain IMI 349063) TaxID=759273 RepID=A0A1B7XS69_COLHI|nr:Catalase [Colletotrichum higginsianum IMI 349063]OBR02638.1 Catalase [Colletotrichum higginsianum IMI 349063]